MKRLAIIVILFSILLCFFGCAIPKPSANEIIEDLAYVEVSPTPYSDDADPEDDGFGIDIAYYDSKSELIHSNVPVEVIIEIYGYKDTYSVFDHAEMEFICTKQAIVILEPPHTHDAHDADLQSFSLAFKEERAARVLKNF